MRRGLILGSLIGIGLLWATFSAGTAEQDKEPVQKKFGIEKRVPWTTSKVVGSPEPPPPYKTELAFPSCRNSRSRST